MRISGAARESTISRLVTCCAAHLFFRLTPTYSRNPGSTPCLPFRGGARHAAEVRSAVWDIQPREVAVRRDSRLMADRERAITGAMCLAHWWTRSRTTIVMPLSGLGSCEPLPRRHRSASRRGLSVRASLVTMPPCARTRGRAQLEVRAVCDVRSNRRGLLDRLTMRFAIAVAAFDAAVLRCRAEGSRAAASLLHTRTLSTGRRNIPSIEVLSGPASTGSRSGDPATAALGWSSEVPAPCRSSVLGRDRDRRAAQRACRSLSLGRSAASSARCRGNCAATPRCATAVLGSGRRWRTARPRWPPSGRSRTRWWRIHAAVLTSRNALPDRSADHTALRVPGPLVRSSTELNRRHRKDRPRTLYIEGRTVPGHGEGDPLIGLERPAVGTVAGSAANEKPRPRGHARRRDRAWLRGPEMACGATR